MIPASEIKRIREYLVSGKPDPGLEDPAGHPGWMSPMSASFQLSPFEAHLLLLLAAYELDSETARLVAVWQESQGFPGQNQPTFGLALAALPDGHWSALGPAGPLRRWRLLEVGKGSRLVDCPLRIDERVLHHLIGVTYLDEQLLGYIEPLSRESLKSGDELTASQGALAETIAGVWAAYADSDERLPAVQLVSEDRYSPLAVARAVCAHLSLGLYHLPAEVLPSAPAELELLQRLWEREAIFSGCALVLSGDWLEAADSTRQSLVQRFVDSLQSPLLIIGRERRRQTRRLMLTYDIPRPDMADQLIFWRSALGSSANSLDGHLDSLAAQFHLSPPAIGTAIVQATGTLPAEKPPEPNGNGLSDPPSVTSLPPADFYQTLWASCRAQARPHLDDMAQRLEPVAGWDDLILPDREKETLRDIALQVRQRTTVYERWQFAAKSARGLGISALFHGPSGTGKTMASEVLANELHLDLYRIDLSQVVSKYIGETEKNLARVFNAAEAGAAILLFDEADALFGKRSEVKDSHDRYANIEIGYLLQRMEAYRGLAILTTNLKDALDQAFVRRIRFMVSFPFPSQESRAAIWERTFPQATPTAGLDIYLLSQLNITGGSIYNIALNAAFFAAHDGRAVTMDHILRATRREFSKLEKSLTGSELRGWEVEE